MDFKPDEVVDVVSVAETRHDARLMLVHALHGSGPKAMNTEPSKEAQACVHGFRARSFAAPRNDLHGYFLNPEGGYLSNAACRSRQSGFCSSINRIFQSRRHFLSSFSREIAFVGSS
jgi:hypothetical protein